MSSTTPRDTALRFWETLQTGGGRAARPEGAPWCFSPGPNSYRLLLIGGTAAVGLGLSDHDQSVSGHLARILTDATGCGAEVDIVADEAMSVRAALQELERRDLRRYNGVVLVLDASDACRPDSHAAALLRPLLCWVELNPAESIPLIVALAPPLPSELSGAVVRSPHPRRLDELELALRSASLSGRRVATVVLPAPQSRDASTIYEEWARPIVEGAVPRLPRPDEPHGAVQEIDVRARQRAVERLGLLEPRVHKEFDQIVEYARLACGTRRAGLAVLDERSAHFVVRRGFQVDALPEDRSICGLAAAELAGLLVGDARRDLRTHDRTAVRDGLVCFYAGYRVESPDGQPVAVLFVADPDPRDGSQTDLATLRNYAMAAQRRLWTVGARRALAR